MGWDEEKAMRSDVNYIALSVEGRVEMFNALFGKQKENKPPVHTRWREFAADHNAIIAKAKRK